MPGLVRCQAGERPHRRAAGKGIGAGVGWPDSGQASRPPTVYEEVPMGRLGVRGSDGALASSTSFLRDLVRRRPALFALAVVGWLGGAVPAETAGPEGTLTVAVATFGNERWLPHLYVGAEDVVLKPMYENL